MNRSPTAPPAEDLSNALGDLRDYFNRAIGYSVIVNLLALIPTLYMIETYGRVVNSRNPNTLLMLTILVLLAYAVMEMSDWVRGKLLQQASDQLDKALSERVFNATFDAQLRGIPAGLAALGDFKALRNFMTSSTALAIADAPISLIFIVIIFSVSLEMGAFSLAGLMVMVPLAIWTERTTGPLLVAAQRAAMDAQRYASSVLANTQVIESMGMWPSVRQRWMARQQAMLRFQAIASDRAGTGAVASKGLQVLMGSLMLGLSAWLTLEGHLVPGGTATFIAWVLSGKALVPWQILISQSKQIAGVLDNYQRLSKFLAQSPEREDSMALPVPKGAVTVEALVAGAPNSQVAILRGVSFALAPGEALAVVGPSAAGKSTLARLLVGLWPAASGRVRLDGVDIYAWNKQELGPHIGYLPQDNELFEGTLADNIARFGEGDEHLLRKAVGAVGLDELVAALPHGLDTLIGAGGVVLSGGQRQRVALARAIYGDPNFIVLDEPNASLDEVGERALLQTLLGLKARGTTLVVMTHRTNVLAAIDKMLVLRDGQVAGFGPRDEVLAALQGRSAVPPAPPPVAAIEGGSA